MNDHQPYPVRVKGDLDPELGRWLWLVKWLLVLPHLVVLAFLWIAFAVLTVVAGVNIAITGRYPRSIFDFNLNVMRWTWRVQHYAFALGTDQYPRFSLEAHPDDPAVLDVEYPEQLSRGLVWVKWWLLAIPHYILVGIFLGGGAHVAGGLTGILAFIGGVMLAVNRRYPSSIYDFVVGLYRWSWRVLAYAALMRDDYPPFRLDTGPDEPGVGPKSLRVGPFGPAPATPSGPML
jgi:hypothetical protein